MATRPRGPAGSTAEAERVLGLLTSLGSTIFRQLLWQKASELDLTFAQSEVLSYVREDPSCHMGEAAGPGGRGGGRVGARGAAGRGPEGQVVSRTRLAAWALAAAALLAGCSDSASGRSPA